MNARTGLFRAWIICSVIWVGYVAYTKMDAVLDSDVEDIIVYYHEPTKQILFQAPPLPYSRNWYNAPQIRVPGRILIRVSPELGEDVRNSPEFRRQVQTASGFYSAMRLDYIRQNKQEHLIDAILRASLPIATLFLAGCAGLWIAAGFRKKPF